MHMMQRKIFGTDGIRGVPNKEPLTMENILELGRAVAYIFRDGAARHKGKIFLRSRCFLSLKTRKVVITTLFKVQRGTALLTSIHRLNNGIATRAEPKPVMP